MLLLLLLLAGAVHCAARIVINELYYDPVGTDTGHEWLELYNAGEKDFNLEGCRILKAGSQFEEVFVFPRFILRAGRYLLLGESQVTGAQFTASLSFQNGGGATDGVRFETADASYTDTVLYDTPNTNLLDDDTSEVGTSFAVDAPSGYSLARIVNGWDTDACGLDFISEAQPTPGFANPLRVDYGLFWPSIRQEFEDWICGVWVKNLSPASAALEAPLEFLLDGVSVGSICVCNIAAQDSIYYEYWLPVTDDDNHLIEMVLDIPGDPHPVNNHLAFWLLEQNQSRPVLNEIMFRPATGCQEWIEIWQSIPIAGSFRIKDRSSNCFGFELPAKTGYFVLCNDVEQLLSRYPDCPSENVIRVSGWASLNNDGDEVWLLDYENAALDSMSYVANATPVDYSLERYEAQEQIRWRTSLDGSGATPGRENSSPGSVPPQQTASVAVYGSPCDFKTGEEISIAYQLKNEANYISCKVYSRSGHLIRILANNQLLSQSGTLVWDGRNQNGKSVPRGIYYIQWHSRAQAGKKELSKRFSIAVRG